MARFDDLITQPGETHLVYGTTRSGKSTFKDWQMRRIAELRPSCMQMLLDSKPRFRAETERMPRYPKGRRSCKWRYEHWSKGPTVPNSVLVDLRSPHPFRGLWTRPGEIALLQSDSPAEWQRMLVLMSAFVRAKIGDRERHIDADEVLDFYGRNTFSVNSKYDVFYLVSRSGGERLISQSLGSQRVKGLPPLVRNMARRVTLYHLREDGDMRYLNENGIPDAVSPTGDFAFRQWRLEPGGTISSPVFGRLAVPESYLAQLAAA